jgi:hypothetical protein
MLGVGIDPGKSFSLSLRGAVSVACHTVADIKRFESAVKVKLERYGTYARSSVAGVTTLSAQDALGRVQGATVLRGAESCSVHASGQNIEKLIPEVSGLLTKSLTGPTFAPTSDPPAPLSFLMPPLLQPRPFEWATLAVKADGPSLHGDFKGKRLLNTRLLGKGSSPFARFTAPGIAVLRLRVPPERLESLATSMKASIPGGSTVSGVVKELAQHLTGNVALLVSHVKVTSGLRSQAARFFATRFALLAETTSPNAANEVLDAIDPKSRSFREGATEWGVSGTTIWFTNDPGTKQAALSALGSALGTQDHGAELEIDPAALAQAFAAVPLVEILQSPELSPVLLAASELAPLLLSTQRISAFVDAPSLDVQRGQWTWTLKRDGLDAGL